LHANGRIEDALKVAENGLKTDGSHSNLLQLAGMSCIQLGLTEKALKLLADKTRTDPGNAHGHLNYGAAFQQAGELERAANCYRQALELEANLAEAHTNLGIVLRDLCQFAEAEDRLRAAIELAPEDSRVLVSLGTVVQSRGRPQEAVAWFDRALALTPGNADTRYKRSLALFGMEEFNPAARDDYEYRWDTEIFFHEKREFPQVLWTGEAIPGQPLLLWAEQGVGDHLSHAGIVPTLTTEGTSCIMECDPRLQTLLARSFPEASVIAKIEPTHPDLLSSDIGFQAPMATASALCRAHRPDIYPLKRFLEPDPDRRKELTQRLSRQAAGRKLVGIAWRSARARIGPLKSMPLDMWGPILASRNSLFVNLQYGETDTEIAEACAVTGAEIYTDPKVDRFDGLDDFAALTDCLDLVITTSNVSAHFAGGLGIPVLLALQKSPLWYWGYEDYPIPLYQSVERFWQKTANDWSNVITGIARRLSEIVP